MVWIISPASLLLVTGKLKTQLSLQAETSQVCCLWSSGGSVMSGCASSVSRVTGLSLSTFWSFTSPAQSLCWGLKYSSAQAHALRGGWGRLPWDQHYPFSISPPGCAGGAGSGGEVSLSSRALMLLRLLFPQSTQTQKQPLST